MVENQSIGQLAGMTTLIGMSVVFTALLLLSVYMNIFKKILTGMTEKKNAPEKESSAPAATAPAAAQSKTPTAPKGSREEKMAAAVAMSLYMDAVSQGASGEVVAAIGAAIALESRGAVALSTPPRPVAGPWKMAGWMESQNLRMDRQMRR